MTRLLVVLALLASAGVARADSTFERHGRTLRYVMPSGWRAADRTDDGYEIAPRSGERLMIRFEITERPVSTDELMDAVDAVPGARDYADTLLGLPAHTFIYTTQGDAGPELNVIMVASDQRNGFVVTISGDPAVASRLGGDLMTFIFGLRLPVAPNRDVDEQSWGLRIGDPGAAWAVAREDDGYLYTTPVDKPTVTVAVHHAWVDGAYKETVRGARPVKLGAEDALLVQDEHESTYHLIRGTQAIVVVVSAQERQAGEQAVAALARGLTVTSVALPRLGARGGVRLAVRDGVAVKLAKGWGLDGFVDGGATFGTAGLTVQLRSGQRQAGAYGGSALAAVRARCAISGNQTIDDEVVVGGHKADRATCRGKGFAPLTAIVTRGGSIEVFILATGKSLPESKLTAFLDGVTIP